MIEIKEQTITLKLDKEGSEILTNGLSILIAHKTENLCKRRDCSDCKENGNRAIKQDDLEVLAKEILNLYFVMYKVSMSTTKIPSLEEIMADLEKYTAIAKKLKPLSNLKEKGE